MDLRADKIFLRGLVVHAHIGPTDGSILQSLEVDLEVSINLCNAAISDSLLDTVNYADLARETADAFVSSHHSNLPEAAAAVAETILSFEPGVREVSLTLRNSRVVLDRVVEEIGVTVVRCQRRVGEQAGESNR